ncbi:MAG: dephospho-CoA kinase [Planctomycetota bacterium]|nr:MAG: dephospho-CoA kinase [Planctomycetota bacterium]REJ94370.1 MAG: dephospho-CoA kinase [Planctomycetota bacterium]REK22098.1 MAG: dephospho-CoA kinase [Planctomycetota bacterium]REK44505.1 MAG: dephospho-CoA kinase [Planctomycetota bacterium]
MKVIGLLGGVASGKSFVAECFRELGAATLDGDQLGHEVLRLAEVKAAARQRWGERIFGADGEIDRGRLSRVVFPAGESASDELDYLESLTHDRIGQRLAAEIDELRATGKTPAVVIDAALLLKAGWDHLCDEVIFVDVPEGKRRRRAEHRGWQEGEFARREQAQLPLAAKRQRASAVVDNGGSREATRQQVQSYWANRVLGGET